MRAVRNYVDVVMAWVDLVRGSVRETHGYASVLTGRDTDAAESLVRAAYATLAEARRQGIEVEAVGRSLRRVVRRRWIEHLAGQPQDRKAHANGFRLLADLPAHVRTIVVLRAIDGMSSARVAREAGISEADVDRLYTQALAWLGETGDGADREWLRPHLGQRAEVPPTLLEQLVTEFQVATTGSRPALAVASYAVGVGELDATPPRGEASPHTEPAGASDEPEDESAEPAVGSAAVESSAESAEPAHGTGAKGWRRIGRRRAKPVAPTPV